MNNDVADVLAQFAKTEGQERLDQLYRYAQVGKCVNGVTHDVNNLLGAALAYAELVQMDSSVSPELSQMLDKIIEAVERCSHLVTTLTAIARPPVDNLSMVDINALLHNVLLLREYSLRVAHVDVQTDLGADLPSLALDSPKIQLALLYLFLNSEENLVGAEGPKRIRLRTHREPESLFVEIQDNGPALTPEVETAMFNRFTSTKPSPSVGLGLPLARAIIERLNGSLTYHPERGFVLSLPFHLE